MRTELSDRSRYDFWSEEKIRWADQDGARHVNNVAYAGYLEDARAEWIIEHLIPHKPKGSMWLVRHVEIDYLGVASYPGRVEVGTCVVALGDTSFTLGQAIFEGTSDHCLVTAKTVHAFRQDRELSPTPPELRTVLETLVDHQS